jgi:Fe-Mn family superoxide dismutase
MMFELTPLPFQADALAPLMSAETLSTHHGKHHAAYVKKTNDLLGEKANHLSSLENVVREAARANDTPLFNQASQAWNHGFFWQCLRPQPSAPPSGEFSRAIEQSFGSMAIFRDQFLAKSTAHFGSGWIWLTADRTGALLLSTLPNAETPIAHEGATPILVCDLWEHAYYLDFKNERPRFLQAFFDKLANWEFAASQYEAARAQRPGWAYPAPTPDAARKAS